MTKKFYSVARLDQIDSEFGVLTDAFNPLLGNYYHVVADGFKTEEEAQIYADKLNGHSLTKGEL